MILNSPCSSLKKISLQDSVESLTTQIGTELSYLRFSVSISNKENTNINGIQKLTLLRQNIPGLSSCFYSIALEGQFQILRIWFIDSKKMKSVTNFFMCPRILSELEIIILIMISVLSSSRKK